ncbi:hypothetical protein [Aurantiacibacter xanthus]|uniref:hypothetical protein n=1 Tax=Aurantiacibacter xanthus TaxID=1784712 RepID=UPI001C726689
MGGACEHIFDPLGAQQPFLDMRHHHAVEPRGLCSRFRPAAPRIEQENAKVFL